MVEILGQPHVTFLPLPSIQFSLLFFRFVLLYPLVLHSLFQILLQSIPRWFQSSIDQLSIYPNVTFLKLDLYSIYSNAFITSSTVEFPCLVFSLLLAALIHLFPKQAT